MGVRRFLVASLLVAAVVLPVGALAIAPPVTFKATGAEQRYTVRPGVRLLAVLVQGAWGGGWGGGSGHYVSTIGQNGAAWQGLLPVTPGETLYIEVGSNGRANGGASFGGGGAAGSPDPEGAVAGSGGGATDIRTCSERASRCPGAGTRRSRGFSWPVAQAATVDLPSPPRLGSCAERAPQGDRRPTSSRSPRGTQRPARYRSRRRAGP